MGKRRKERLNLPIKILGDLAKPSPDAPVILLTLPAICSRCGGPLEMRWEFHARGVRWAYARWPT